MSGEQGHTRPGWLPSAWWSRSIALFVIILLIGLVWFFACQPRHEPIYMGKSLTSWLQTYAPSSPHGRGSREWNQADEAIHHIGTNAIPILLEMIDQRDSELKLRLMDLLRKQHLVKVHFVPAAELNAEATKAFIALGSVAKGAVPDLLKMLNGNISTESLAAIEDTLGWIGPDARPAIPVLLQGATNSNSKVRANALWALGEIHTEPQVCVPALVGGLSDTDDWVRLSAAHALGMFGSDAQAAVYRLSQMTNLSTGTGFSLGTKLEVMLEARKAIKKIDPQTVSPPAESFFDLGRTNSDWPIGTQ